MNMGLELLIALSPILGPVAFFASIFFVLYLLELLRDVKGGYRK